MTAIGFLLLFFGMPLFALFRKPTDLLHGVPVSPWAALATVMVASGWTLMTIGLSGWMWQNLP